MARPPISTRPPARGSALPRTLAGILVLAAVVAALAFYLYGTKGPQPSTAARQPASPSRAPTDAFSVNGPFAVEKSGPGQATANETGGFTTISGPPSDPNFPPGITLPSRYEAAFAGKQIVVTVNARSSGANGASSFSVVYYTLGFGNSGGQPMTLTGEFRDVSFRYAVPQQDGQGTDYLGFILPEGASVDIRSIRIAPAS